MCKPITIFATLKEVEELNSQITNYQGQISSLDTQINEADTKIKQAEEELAQKQKEYEKKQETLQKRLVYIYEAGETSYLDVLLNSSSLADFISKYYIASELTEIDTQLVEDL